MWFGTSFSRWDWYFSFGPSGLLRTSDHCQKQEKHNIRSCIPSAATNQSRWHCYRSQTSSKRSTKRSTKRRTSTKTECTDQKSVLPLVASFCKGTTRPGYSKGQRDKHLDWPYDLARWVEEEKDVLWPSISQRFFALERTASVLFKTNL